MLKKRLSHDRLIFNLGIPIPRKGGFILRRGSCLCLERVEIRSYDISKHDDVIKWKHFPRYWPFVRGIHRSPVNPPLKGQWRGSFMFSLICAWINGWVNNREAGDLKLHCAHNDVIVMKATKHVGVIRRNDDQITMFFKYFPNTVTYWLKYVSNTHMV